MGTRPAGRFGQTPSRGRASRGVGIDASDSLPVTGPVAATVGARPATAPPPRDMVWIPGGTFRMGSDAALRGGAPGPRRGGRRLLDGRAPGDGGRVPPLREGDGARHRRRTRPRPCRVPRCRAGAARARLARVPPNARPGQPRRLPQLVALGARRAVASSRGSGQHDVGAATATRSPTSPTRTRPHTPPGRARRCRPRPNGSSPRAAASTERSTRGATSSRPRAG